MKNKFFGALYVLNIISQAIFTLLTPTGVFFALSWFLVRKLSFPTWTYAVLITLGVLIGFYTMIKFVISAAESLERLERQSNKKRRKNNE